MMTPAPISRDASTVWTRWLATGSSTSGDPGDVDDDDLSPGASRIAAQQLVGELVGPLRCPGLR